MKHDNGKVNFLPDTRVALVSHDNWPLLLIGHDVLAKQKATPEQVLSLTAVDDDEN